MVNLPSSPWRTFLRFCTFACGAVSFITFTISRPDTIIRGNAVDYFMLPIGLTYFSSFATMIVILMITSWRFAPDKTACCFSNSTLKFLEVLLDIGMTSSCGSAAILSAQRTVCTMENTARYPGFCNLYNSAVAFMFFCWFCFGVSSIWNILHMLGFLEDVKTTTPRVSTAVTTVSAVSNTTTSVSPTRATSRFTGKRRSVITANI
ncbi:hypothetical protein BKA69DRAFT_1123863 [Paraphysoderma sedebokerense]|nr:hypothetical protein BKA69DRAFT_1123863 [Paraphysoderma sedebokerense]